jgi:hypothetical protein
MIDHGSAFGGPSWRFMDGPLHGLYFRPAVYRDVRRMEDFEPWLWRIRGLPESVLTRAVKQIPKEWLAPARGQGDGFPLDEMLDQLIRRRHRVASLLDDCVRNNPQAFPNWRR